jgi:hypothetical protein
VASKTDQFTARANGESINEEILTFFEESVSVDFLKNSTSSIDVF